MKHIKRLPLAGANNIRDLGGYMIDESHMTKWNTCYRGDNLHRLTASDWKKLYDANVRTIIDLRSLAERNNEGYDSEAYGIKTYHLPMQKEQIDMHDLHQSLAKDSFWFSLSEGYMGMINDNQQGIGSIFNQISESLHLGAVLFHCTAGKDRTGMTAFLLLKLLGVNKADIIADYEVSSTYNTMGASTNELLKRIPEKYLYLLNSDPKNVTDVIQYFEEHDIETYLISCGVKETNIAYLKTAMRESL